MLKTRERRLVALLYRFLAFPAPRPGQQMRELDPHEIVERDELRRDIFTELNR